MLALSLCVLFSVFSSSSVLGLTLKSHRCIAVSVPACVLPTDDTVFHRLLCFFFCFFLFLFGSVVLFFFFMDGSPRCPPTHPLRLCAAHLYAQAAAVAAQKRTFAHDLSP